MRHLIFVLRQRPDLTDRWGHHFRPIHYYEPLPDFRQLNPADLLRERLSPAIEFRVEAQIKFLSCLGSSYGGEVAELAALPGESGFDFQNSFFGALDAAVYYSLIRHLKPKTVLEIGSGFSTRIAAKAVSRNEREGNPAKLVCIEPYPEPRLTQSSARFELIEKRVQDVPLSTFEALEPEDILFIDSSHITASGSDVNFEYFEILPRLKPGVWVHVHDIFYPADYPPQWLIDKRIAFNEQYLLEAFLSFNSAYSVQLANAWAWRQKRDATSNLFAGAVGESPPASLWMKRDA